MVDDRIIGVALYHFLEDLVSAFKISQHLLVIINPALSSSFF
jgi:hypothetical protein